jgi:hypothetical protein
MPHYAVGIEREVGQSDMARDILVRQRKQKFRRWQDEVFHRLAGADQISGERHVAAVEFLTKRAVVLACGCRVASHASGLPEKMKSRTIARAPTERSVSIARANSGVQNTSGVSA